jgi:enoyl-CoA hydratase/carnithine racemase
MSDEDIINRAINRLAELTGEDFHGYRSEVWGVISEAVATERAARERAEAAINEIAEEFREVYPNGLNGYGSNGDADLIAGLLYATGRMVHSQHGKFVLWSGQPEPAPHIPAASGAEGG